MSTLRRLLRSASGRIIILTFICGILIDVFGSFELSERYDAINSEIIGALTGPFYPFSPSGERAGQKNITLVLIDRKTLDSFDAERWPPSYKVQGEIAERVARLGPAAIFVDLYYSRARKAEEAPKDADLLAAFERGEPIDPAGGAREGSVLELAATYQSIASRGISVLIGPVGDPKAAEIAPALQPLTNVPQAGITIERFPSIAYPMKDGAGREQAAVQLYRDWCARNVEIEARCMSMVDLPPDAKLGIQWGFGVSAEMSDLLVPHQRSYCRGNGGTDRLLAAWRIFFARAFPIFYEGNSKASFRCPYFDTVPVWLLLDASFDAEKFIKDRIVLIGSDLPQLADFVEAPLVGRVPGVTIHAMALDNLISLPHTVGPAFYPSMIPGTRMSYKDLVEAGLVLVGFVFLLMAHLAFIRFHPNRTSYTKGMWAIQIMLAVFVPCAIGIFVSLALSWSIVNIVAIAAMGAWNMFLLSGEVADTLEG